MKPLHFSADIAAKPEKIWKILWDDATYRQWTRPFMEGSYYKAPEWKEGATIHFLSPDGSGMYSRIEKLDENEYVSFKHIGELKAGKELPLDDKSRLWTGSMENYRLVEKGDHTEIQIELEFPESEAGYMEQAWPKALEVLKQLAEKQATAQ